MSTNIHFVAKRRITFKKKNGKRSGEVQQVHFDEWQTPTTVTYEILKSPNPIQTYKDWILKECSRDQQLPVYAEDDYLQEGQPVRFEIYNAGKEHIQKFDEWIESVEEQGFTVTAEAW